MRSPGVEDCPSSVTHVSYKNVVLSGVKGSVVVGNNVVVAVVVGIVVIIDLSLNNFSCRRRRRRAILSLLFLSALIW